MSSMDIYVDFRHLDFWWGYYGLSYPTLWEDVLLYRKTDEGFEEIAYFCLCGRNYFARIDDLRAEPSEEKCIAEIDEYLEKNEIHYWMKYRTREDEDFYEVKFEAPRNEEGVKPCYIELWHPAQRIDEDVLVESVKDFCRVFLGLSVEHVMFKNKKPYEEAKKEYEECSGPKTIVFSDELVERLMVEWKLPREEVLQKLETSAEPTEPDLHLN